MNSNDSAGQGGDCSAQYPIHLTNLSKALAALQAESPEMAAKLADLYAVVRAGNYEIDTQALTGTIIRDASGATGQT